MTTVDPRADAPPPDAGVQRTGPRSGAGPRIDTDPRSGGVLPPEGRAALRAGVVGNWVDNLHMFLPVVALAPAMATLAGPAAAAGTGALVVVAMLLGRPIGALALGRVSDRLGRTRVTRFALLGTAGCAFAIAALPSHEIWGAGTLAALVVLRFLGGIFIAGEYSAAIPLAMEWSAPRRRGLWSGLILSMAPWAQAAIALATAALVTGLGQDAYAAWGWRVLFVVGGAASIGMWAYYRSVADAPAPRRALAPHPAPAAPRPGRPAEAGRVSDLLVGRYARRFRRAFVMMTGLWLLTVATVLVLPSRLGGPGGLSASDAALAMGVASIAQALAMSVAGHASTLLGRRRLLIGWGLLAALAGPMTWWAAVASGTPTGASLFAAVCQVVTVSAYGPVAAYLSEAFPTAVRSTGYGIAYSWSLVLPMLYPFWLPALAGVAGETGAVLGVLAAGGLLVVAGAAAGPALRPAHLDADLDAVAEADAGGLR